MTMEIKDMCGYDKDDMSMIEQLFIREGAKTEAEQEDWCLVEVSPFELAASLTFSQQVQERARHIPHTSIKDPKLQQLLNEKPRMIPQWEASAEKLKEVPEEDQSQFALEQLLRSLVKKLKHSYV